MNEKKTCQDENVKNLYRYRFQDDKEDQRTLHKKNKLWQVLCRDFFQKFVPPDSCIIDIGAGYCEFINNIQTSGRKIAVDLNEDIRSFAASEVEVIYSDVMDIEALEADSCDIMFISNFLEHLKSKEDILRLFAECRRLLRKGGRLLILQPDIKLAKGAYWDFFDHYIPLTVSSLKEGLTISGFQVEYAIPRFLPYTTKSRLPQNPWLLSLYLKLPFIWYFFSGQCFVAATPIKDLD